MPAKKNSPNGPALDQLLIDAASNYARRVTGQDLQRITLSLVDGTTRTIDVAPTVALVSDWPPERGWAVRGDRGARDGETFRLTGKPLAVFAALVGVGDVGITMPELKRAVWDEHAEDRTAQNMISRLRHLIRDGLRLSGNAEPIDADGERYRLAVG